MLLLLPSFNVITEPYTESPQVCKILVLVTLAGAIAVLKNKVEISVEKRRVNGFISGNTKCLRAIFRRGVNPEGSGA